MAVAGLLSDLAPRYAPPMARRSTGPLPTLRDDVAAGLVISTYCNACLTAGRELEPADLAALLGWQATKEDIERRLRCTR
jgi:hypothetical protein